MRATHHQGSECFIPVVIQNEPSAIPCAKQNNNAKVVLCTLHNHSFIASHVEKILCAAVASSAGCFCELLGLKV